MPGWPTSSNPAPRQGLGFDVTSKESLSHSFQYSAGRTIRERSSRSTHHGPRSFVTKYKSVLFFMLFGSNSVGQGPASAKPVSPLKPIPRHNQPPILPAAHQALRGGSVSTFGQGLTSSVGAAAPAELSWTETEVGPAVPSDALSALTFFFGGITA